MADVAVLGLKVDASGAIVELRKFDDATRATGATAAKTQSQVSAMGGGFKAADGSVHESYLSMIRYEGALNKAANEQRRAMQAARELALAEQAQAQAAAQAAAAAATATNTTTAMGKAAGFGEAEFNRLRGSLTGLLTPILGTVGSGNALVSTLSQLTVGAGATVGILAGVAAIGAAYDLLSEKTKALKEANDKARKALDDVARAQRLGIGGELAEQIGNQVKALDELKKKQGEIAQQSSGGFSQGKIGTTSDADLSRQREIAAQIKATDEAIAAGKRELARVVIETERDLSSSQTRLAAELAKSNSLTIAEQAKARDRLKTLKADIDASLRLGGDQTERARLIADFETLNAALNPSTAKAAAKASREHAAALQDEAKATDVIAQLEAQRNRERNAKTAEIGIDAVAKLDAQIKAARDLRVADGQRQVAILEQLAAMQAQVDLIGKTKAEQEKLIDQENQRVAAAKGYSEEQAKQYVQLQRDLRTQVDATQAWQDALQSVATTTAQIAGAFGEVGRQIGSAIGAAESLTLSFRKMIAAQNAAKAAQGTANQASAASAASAATVSTFVAAAAVVISVGSALNRLIDPSERLRRKADELAEAYNRQFAAARKLVDVRTDNPSAISDTTSSLTRIAEQTLGAALKAATANGKPDGAAINAAFKAFQQALDDIATFAADRAKAIEEQARKVAAFAKDNDVLALRIQGRNDEADAMQVQIEIERKYQEAVALYGDTAETARYHTLLLAQATDAAAQAAIKKAETERRSVFDLTNGAQAFTDPRGAADAAFAEAQQRRYNDAVTRGASAAELAAIQFYNLAEAMDRAAQIAEQDRRTQESLVGRVLGTLGNDRATQDYVTAATQRQEIADAIRNGMSPSNLALLQFTQRVENSYTQMQRAIEDGTKAIQDRAKNEIAAIDVLIEVTQTAARAQIAKIDEQIKETQTLAKATAKAYDEQIAAIREQTKAQTDAIEAQIEAARGALEAANATVTALDKQVQTNLKVVEALQAFKNSLKLGDLSTLSPEGKLAEARRQFEALASAAQGGNADAATQLPAAAQAFLQASRAFNASGSGFVNDSARVNTILDALTQQFGATLPIDQQQLEAARQSVTALQSTVDALGKEKDAITKAAEAQIAVIQKAKDKAAEDAQRVIDKLNENKQKIQDDTAATIAKLEETKTAIQDAAQRQIDQLVRVETEAHQFRIRQDEYWQTFLGTGAFNPTGNGPETLPGDGTTTPVVTPILQSQLAAQEENTRVLGEKLDGLTAVLDRLLTTTVTASDVEVGEQAATTAAVQYVGAQIRQLGQALVARSR